MARRPLRASRSVSESASSFVKAEDADLSFAEPRDEAAVPLNLFTSQYSNPDSNFFDDGTLTFFWRPHTALVALAVVASIIYMAFNTETTSTEENVKRGVGVACGVFLVTCVVLLRDGPFYRPHPAIWRLILGATILYELVLVFLLFQSVEDGRKFMKYYDPELGKVVPFEDYAEECSLYDESHYSGNPFFNFTVKIDRFVLAHIIGWFVKALIFRNFIMCHISSIVFELLEYTFTFHLPNFNECWWDHWILDALGCNAIGIWFGMKMCHYLDIKEYNWKGLSNIPSYPERLQRGIQQFTPYYWTSFQWDPFRNLKTWLTSLTALTLQTTMELTAFYLKSVLWIPSSSPLNIYRLFLISFSAPVAIREIYQFGNDPSCKRFGQQAWVLALILATEVLISIKYGQDMFANSSPDMFWVYFWIVVLGLIALYTVYLALVSFNRSRPTRPVSSTSQKVK